MNNKTLDHLLIAITVLLDFCFVATAIVVAYWVRFESGWTPETLALHKGGTPPLDDYFRLIPLMVIIWLMTLKALKLYRPESNATFSAFWTLCKAAGISLIATLAALFFIYHHDAYSRWVMLLATGFSLVWLFLGRLVLHRFRQSIHAQGVGVNRLVIVGNDDARVEKFINVLNAKADSGYEVVGIIDEIAVSQEELAVRNKQLPHTESQTFSLRSKSTANCSPSGKVKMYLNWCKNIDSIRFSSYHRRCRMTRSCRFSMPAKGYPSKLMSCPNSPNLSGTAETLLPFLMAYQHYN